MFSILLLVRFVKVNPLFPVSLMMTGEWRRFTIKVLSAA
jgi:hypothetical protein